MTAQLSTIRQKTDGTELEKQLRLHIMLGDLEQKIEDKLHDMLNTAGVALHSKRRFRELQDKDSPEATELIASYRSSMSKVLEICKGVEPLLQEQEYSLALLHELQVRTGRNERHV